MPRVIRFSRKYNQLYNYKPEKPIAQLQITDSLFNSKQSAPFLQILASLEQKLTLVIDVVVFFVVVVVVVIIFWSSQNVP